MANVQEVVENLKGATFIGIRSETEPKMRKTGNPYFGRVHKVSRINGQVNFHYDAAVLRQLAKEGKDASCFFAGESWHEAVVREDGTLTPFCRHKTTRALYLRVRSLGVSEVKYLLDDGTEVDKAELERFLYPSSDYANQGTDDPIRFIVFKLESVKELTINGEVHRF